MAFLTILFCTAKIDKKTTGSDEKTAKIDKKTAKINEKSVDSNEKSAESFKKIRRKPVGFLTVFVSITLYLTIQRFKLI